jgi:hypothetical protein
MPHFHLWRYFFKLKKTGKGVVVGSVSFMLRRNMKSKYIDLALPDNTTGWKQGWFYLDNPTPVMRSKDGSDSGRRPGMDQLAGDAGHPRACWTTCSSSRRRG